MTFLTNTERVLSEIPLVFYQLDEIGNNDNIGIRGFTTWKQKNSVTKCFLLIFGGHVFFLWGHWYPCIGLLVMFQSQSGQPYSHLAEAYICVIHSLRFTSGVTPANLLAASMAAELSLPHTCEALVGLKTESYHVTAHSVRSGRHSIDWAIPARL